MKKDPTKVLIALLGWAPNARLSSQQPLIAAMWLSPPNGAKEYCKTHDIPSCRGIFRAPERSLTGK